MNESRESTMKCGLVLSATRISDQVTAAKNAEAAGFHSVWTTEFFTQHGCLRLAAVKFCAIHCHSGASPGEDQEHD